MNVASQLRSKPCLFIKKIVRFCISCVITKMQERRTIFDVFYFFIIGTPVSKLLVFKISFWIEANRRIQTTRDRTRPIHIDLGVSFIMEKKKKWNQFFPTTEYKNISKIFHSWIINKSFPKSKLISFSIITFKIRNFSPNLFLTKQSADRVI